MHRPRFLPLLPLAASLFGCSDAAETNAEKTRAQDAPTPVAPTSPAQAEPTTSPTAEDTAADTDERDVPCAIRWQDGPTLSLSYTEGGGEVALDQDRDGTPETCQRFTTKDGSVVGMTIGPCDEKKPTARLEAVTKASAPAANLSFFAYRSGKGRAKPLTLVLVPGFSGILPGYPLHADVSKIRLDIEDQRVRTAHVRRPWEGPAVRVTFAYDERGRVTQIEEDLEADGRTDRTFVYHYEGERLRRIESHGIALPKTEATLDYGC